MRGHWISQTRKLNKHYQNGGPQEKLAGAVIRSVSAINALSMPFIERINPDTGARELRLGLCGYYHLNAATGKINTSGVAMASYWNEDYVEGLIEEGETNDWVLVDFIPHMEINLYYGNPLTGSRVTYINTRDKTKFEINTGKVKTTIEELTFRNFVNFGTYEWVKGDGTRASEPFGTSTVAMGGLCLWIKKDQMTYRKAQNYYTLTSAKCKELLDEVDFGVQFYRKTITNCRIHVRSTGIGYPYFRLCPFEGDFYDIGKTYHPQYHTWLGWATTKGRWSQYGLSGNVIERTEAYPQSTKHFISYKFFSRFVYELNIVLPLRDGYGLMDGLMPANNSVHPSSLVSYSCNGRFVLPKDEYDRNYDVIGFNINTDQYCDIEFVNTEKSWRIIGDSIYSVGKKLYKIMNWYNSQVGFWGEYDSQVTTFSNFYDSTSISASSEVVYEE